MTQALIEEAAIARLEAIELLGELERERAHEISDVVAQLKAEGAAALEGR